MCFKKTGIANTGRVVAMQVRDPQAFHQITVTGHVCSGHQQTNNQNKNTEGFEEFFHENHFEYGEGKFFHFPHLGELTCETTGPSMR